MMMVVIYVLKYNFSNVWLVKKCNAVRLSSWLMKYDFSNVAVMINSQPGLQMTLSFYFP